MNSLNESNVAETENYDADKEIESLLFLPEQDDGNIEYKRFLLNPTPERIEKLCTQMRFRLEEGQGEAYYVVGLDDNGDPFGVTQDEYEKSKATLETVADKNGYVLRELYSVPVESKPGRSMHEFIVRENTYASSEYEEIRVAIAGNVDSSKSTTVGVLTSGEPDDGRGSARLKVFNYQHEVKSGRTSSISHQILGFAADGKVVNRDPLMKKQKTWPEIIRDSTKIVSFYDLCGHQKYMKTTISGMTASFADIAFVLVGANMGMSKVTREHFSICVTLNIPIVVLISKIDLCEKAPQKVEETITKVKRFLRLPVVRKIPYAVQNMQDVITVAQSIRDGAVTPIFKISNVSMMGIDLLSQFLNLVRPRLYKSIKSTEFEPVRYHVADTFRPQGIGLVIGGFLSRGVIKVKDQLLLGPFGIHGTFINVSVRSIHVKRVLSEQVVAGRYACLKLKPVDAKKKLERKMVKKGMVVVSEKTPKAVKTFDARIIVYRTHSTTIRVCYEPVLHVRSLRTATQLIGILDKERVELKTSVEDKTSALSCSSSGCSSSSSSVSSCPKQEASSANSKQTTNPPPKKSRRSRHNKPSAETSDPANLTVLSLGDRATVRLRFKYKPNCVSVGDKILLTESSVRMSGEIVELVEFAS